MTESIIGVFSGHQNAEAAIKSLTRVGFNMKALSMVGKGSIIDEKVACFYNIGDRVEFWGTRGVFWGEFLGAVLRWHVPDHSDGRSCSLRDIATGALSDDGDVQVEVRRMLADYERAHPPSGRPSGAAKRAETA